MRTSIFAVLALAAAFLTGCPESPPPITPDAPPDNGPVVLDDGRPDPVPRSIRRLLAEEHRQMIDIRSLLDVIGDARGRARAVAQAEDLDAQLASVERAVDATGGDSDSLDATFDEIRRLHTRISLLHDALTTASL
ncbi:MAG TPA: hypothetical protein VIF62_23125 [Labilithrix sp.]